MQASQLLGRHDDLRAVSTLQEHLTLRHLRDVLLDQRIRCALNLLHQAPALRRREQDERDAARRELAAVVRGENFLVRTIRDRIFRDLLHRRRGVALQLYVGARLDLRDVSALSDLTAAPGRLREIVGLGVIPAVALNDVEAELRLNCLLYTSPS